MKYYKILILMIVLVVLSIVFYINQPKKLVYNFNNNIAKLISELPPLDQGSPENISNIPKNIYQIYLNETKRKACIVNKVEISNDKIDLNQSITINVEIQNITKIDNCPCVLKIETSDHFDIPDKDKIKILTLDQDKIVNPALWLLTPKKEGIASISICKLVKGTQYDYISKSNITINWFYGLNQAYKDLIVFICIPLTLIVGIIAWFKSQLSITWITLKKDKHISRHVKNKLDDKYIEITFSPVYFSETFLNKNNEWRKKKYAVFFLQYYSSGQFKDKRISKIIEMSNDKYEAIKNIYGDVAIYFKTIIYQQNDINNIFKDIEGYESHVQIIKSLVLPIYIICSFENDQTNIVQVIDISIFNMESNKDEKNSKEIIKQLYEKHEQELS